MTNTTKYALLALALVLATLAGFRLLTGNASESPSPAPVAKQNEPPAPKRASHEEASRPAPPIPASLDDDPVGELRLEGQVVDENDDPVAGASIILGSAPPRTATSEADGSFAFDDLVQRRYSVHARSSDRVGGPVMVSLSETSDPVLVRMHAGGGIEVQVVDDLDQPIAGATVYVPALDTDVEQTDSDGIAVIRNLPPGQSFVSASASGYARASSLVTIPRSTEILGRQRLTLRPGVSVSGLVVDEEGNPVADAKVIAEPVGTLFSLQDPKRDGVSTDARGRFEISAVPAGMSKLKAVHEDHAPSTSEAFQVGDSPLKDLTLEMQEGASVAGKVTTQDGAAVPWATVRVISSAQAGYRSNGVHRQMIADEEGGFLFKGLPRQELVVHGASDLASSEGLEVDLRSKPRQEELNILLSVAGVIAGVVVNENGEPVAEAQVRAVPDFWEGADMDQLRVRGPAFATTGGDGSFAIRGLPESRYKLGASRGLERGTQGLGGDVSAQTGDQQVRLVLATPATLVGEVRASDGTTPELATVSIGWGSGTPASEGQFRLSDIPPGTYEVTVRGPDFADTFVPEVEVQAGETLDLGTVTVKKGRSVRGRVVDASGQPVAGAEVVLARQLVSDGKSLTPEGMGSLMDERSGVRRTTSDEQGRFRLRGLGEAEWTIAADHPQVGRSVGQTLASGSESLELNLSLLDVGSVRGVVSVDGRPQPSVQVLISPTEGSAHIVVVSTDERGAFIAERVAVGETKVSVMIGQATSSSMAATTVTVEAGQEVEAILEVHEGSVTLAVSIAGEAGATIDAAQVFLFRGVANVTTGGALNKLFLSEAANAKMGFSFGSAGTKFEKVSAGQYSVCIIPINGDMNDPAFAQKLQRHVNEIAVYCQPVEVAEGPENQSHKAVVPPMSPLPED